MFSLPLRMPTCCIFAFDVLDMPAVRTVARQRIIRLFKVGFAATQDYYTTLPDTSKDDTRQALAKMFLPRRARQSGRFDWKFLDFGLVHRYHSTDGISVLYNPITPAAKGALLD